ncbi:DUF3291 domain-containing protein [Nocardiopsis tropica]|uniref:DUF3291 domain-containing protein n=1 Tax=Nocardiopsis tropica TaxID=109330 RepID=A0ABV1ZQB5_9ACTN
MDRFIEVHFSIGVVVNLLAQHPRTVADHPRTPHRTRTAQGAREGRPLLAESRTVLGDRRYLAPLAAALRKRAAGGDGAPEEVHFSDGGDRIHVIALWRSPTDLREFVEASHGDLLDFRALTGAFPRVGRVLWWAADGAAVTPEEAAARAEHLREHGPRPHAFTLASPVPAPA